MAFGEKMKQLRNEKGLTQQQLAEELNITKRTIINYEGGKSYPTTDALPRIASFFGVVVNDLMDEQEEFIAEARERGGYRGKHGAKQLIAEVSGLFAGGDLSEADKDAVMRALQEAYWEAKKENKKYTPKKYRK